MPFGVSVNDRGDGGFGSVTSFNKVRKGLYVKNSRDEPFSREIFADLVYGPSYLSLEYALGLSRSDPRGRPDYNLSHYTEEQGIRDPGGAI